MEIQTLDLCSQKLEWYRSESGRILNL